MFIQFFIPNVCARVGQSLSQLRFLMVSTADKADRMYKIIQLSLGKYPVQGNGRLFDSHSLTVFWGTYRPPKRSSEAG